MACGKTIREVHGELTGFEIFLASEYDEACVAEAGHTDDHLFPALDRSGRLLHCTTAGTLAVFPRQPRE